MTPPLSLPIPLLWSVQTSYHGRDVQLVVLELLVLHVQRDFGESHRGAEVKEGGDAVVRKVLPDNQEGKETPSGALPQHETQIDRLTHWSMDRLTG